MNKESFDQCMQRLFGTDKYQGINRLDLFKILFDDQAKKIEALEKEKEDFRSSSINMTVAWKNKREENKNLVAALSACLSVLEYSDDSFHHGFLLTWEYQAIKHLLEED